MAYEIEIVECQPSPLASVKRRVAWGDLGRAVPEMLTLVYDVIRAGATTQDGHNVCIYREPDREGVELEAGVQVAGPFPAVGEVLPSNMPSGRAAHVVHFGPYDKLGEAHDALTAVAGGGAGPSWEVYGDWEEDPQRRRTDVYRAAG